MDIMGENMNLLKTIRYKFIQTNWTLQTEVAANE